MRTATIASLLGVLVLITGCGEREEARHRARERARDEIKAVAREVRTNERKGRPSATASHPGHTEKVQERRTVGPLEHELSVVPSGHAEKVQERRPGEPMTQSWTVTGRGFTLRDAEREALEEARADLLQKLREEGRPLAWTPSLEDIEARLVKSKQAVGDLKVELDEDDHESLRQVEVVLAMDSADLAYFLSQDHQYRVQQRHLALGKILAVLVALLGAVAVYFRLDEATKGYYTGWLRLGALLVIAGVGAGLLLLA